MPTVFDITHSTHYRYAQPVLLGEHRVLFRPRDSHDLRVLATDLQVSPEPLSVRLIQDAYSNSVALVQARSPASEFRVLCSFSVELIAAAAVDFALSPAALTFPFAYDDEERLVLAHYLLAYYDDPQQVLAGWAAQFAPPTGSVGTREPLLAMARFIRDTLHYRTRYEPGVQTPQQTLALQSGSCRDFATLMIEAVRHLGYAARFVSGYLYLPWADSGERPGFSTGSTHAWVQVYLPGAGWVAFDPTNDLTGGAVPIRVGVARHASLASPVSGSWSGFPSDFLGLDVDVQVRQRR